LDNYCLTVTYKCQWHCPYCITDTHSKSIEYDQVLDNIKRIPDRAHVSLSGGEPGMLPTGKIIEVINRLREKQCVVQVNSNGLIFKRPAIVDMVDFIFYHCSENLDIDDEVVKDYPDKTQYMVVVTDNNIDKLRSFLDKHNDIHISIYAAKEVPVNGKVGEHLSKKNAIRLVREFKDYIKPDEVPHILNFNEYTLQTEHIK